MRAGAISVGILMQIAGFIVIMEKLVRHASLHARFSFAPLCTKCHYNLTGKLSGICPERGTLIVAAKWRDKRATCRLNRLVR